MSDIIKVERLNHSGEGISQDLGLITFIPKTISGDIVEIEIIEKSKNYQRAKVINYKKRADNCINPSCKYYYECGGCHISNLPYNKQLEYKKNRVKDIFKRYLAIDIDFDIIFSEKILGYRNKITLQIKNGEIGLFENRTNNIIKIDKCLLVSDNLNNIIKKLKKLDLIAIKKIILRETKEEIMMIIEGNISKEILLEFKEADTIILNNQTIKGKGYIEEKINDLEFIISPDSFFQVNSNQVVKLYNKVLEYANITSKDRVIDLYCGTGTIGIYLARYCKQVLGIEINESSIKDANKNKKLNNIENIEFIQGDVGNIINNSYQASIIVVDPPRSGLDKKTRKALLEILPQKIIYVSCDTMTLVRDLKELLNKYEIKDGTLVDMFPQTYHVESVILLQRKD